MYSHTLAIDEAGRHYAKSNTPVTEGQILQDSLLFAPVTFIFTGVRRGMVIVRRWRDQWGGDGELAPNAAKFLLGKLLHIWSRLVMLTI